MTERSEMLSEPGHQLYSQARRIFESAQPADEDGYAAGDENITLRSDGDINYVSGRLEDELCTISIRSASVEAIEDVLDTISYLHKPISQELSHDSLFSGREFLQLNIDYRIWTGGSLGGTRERKFLLNDAGDILEILSERNQYEEGSSPSYRIVSQGEASDLLDSVNSATFL